MHAHFGTKYHQRISHIIAGISHIHQLHTFHSAQVLFNGQKVCQHLCRVVFIRQPIPYRNTCIFCQFLHDFLSKASVLNSIVNPAQNSGSIFNALLFSNLGTFRVQICSAHSQIMGCRLKRTACSCTVFLKNQSNVLAFQRICKNTFFFLFLQIRGQIQ